MGWTHDYGDAPRNRRSASAPITPERGGIDEQGDLLRIQLPVRVDGDGVREAGGRRGGETASQRGGLAAVARVGDDGQL